MPMSYPPRVFAGYPVAGTLDSPGISSSDGPGTGFYSSTTLTGWQNVTGASLNGTQANGPYITIAFGYGTANEEKMLVALNTSTNQFTIVTRAYENGTARTWTAGSLFIMIWSATEAAELNATTQAMKTILGNSGTTTTPQPILIGSSSGSIGSGTKPAAIDHDHKISASELNSFLGGSSANATLGSNLAVPPANLASGAIPSGVTIPLSQVTNPPAADSQANGTAITATTTSSTTNWAGATQINPTGSFKQYVWRVTCQQAGNASVQTDLTAYIRYRVVGTSTWTTVSSGNCGTAVTPNDFRQFSAGGVVTVGSADDYEFNVSFATSSGTVSINRTVLTVQGLN